MVASAANKKAFGFEGYTSPTNKQHFKHPFSPQKFPKLTVPREKKETFITEVVKKKSFIIQGPDHYSKIVNWDKVLPARRGMFLKSER